MSPRPPQSFSKTTPTNTFKSYKSPPPKKQPLDEDTPPVPPPPPPPLVIPGPNAFAQQKRVISDERRALEASGRLGTSGSPTQSYTVKSYRDLDASHISPTIARHKMRATRNHHRANSSTDDSHLSAPSSAAVETATWGDLAEAFETPAAFFKQQQATYSKFYQNMRLARDRLDEHDEDNEKRQQQDSQPMSAASEKLRLASSPDPNVAEIPTHRAALDEKTQERFKSLINNNGTVSHGVQIANVHEGTPEPQKSSRSDTPCNKSSAKTDKSPKKGGFFNKLGLGLKMSGQDEHQSTVNRQPSMRNVPPKAARVLGAQSLPSRDRQEASTRARAWDDVSPDINSPVADSPGRTSSAPSPKTLTSPSKVTALSPPLAENHSMPQPNQTAGPKSPLRRESRRIPKRDQLRQYDDDNPPTPPSKPRLSKTTDAHNQEVTSARAEESEQDKSDTARNTEMQNSLHPTGSHRAGYAGHHASAQLGVSPAISSMYGSFQASPDPSPSSQFPQDHFSKRINQILYATRDGRLPPSRYDPKSPQAKWSFSHLPPSMENLKPIPLRLPEHKRSQSSNQLDPQKSSANDSSAKTRNASESTSMSVPVFVDGQDRSMSAACTSDDTPRGDPGGQEHGDAEPLEFVLTTEMIFEYLVETFNQNEALKASLRASSETVEAMEMHMKSNNANLTTQLAILDKTTNQHFSAVHDVLTTLTETGQKHEAATAANAISLAQLQSQTSTLTSNMQAIKSQTANFTTFTQDIKAQTAVLTNNMQDIHSQTANLTNTMEDIRSQTANLANTKQDVQHHFGSLTQLQSQTASLANTMQDVQHHFGTLSQLQSQSTHHTNKLQDIQRYLRSLATTHILHPAIRAEASTATSPTSSLSPTTADFAPQVTHPSQHAQTYPPYTSPVRACTPSPQRSPDKTQTARSLQNRTQPQAQARLQPQPIQRIDTIPLFGSSPMRSPGSRGDMHADVQPTPITSAQAHAGVMEHETSTNTNTGTSGIGGMTGTGTSEHRASGPRGYLQSVPQSAVTDPGVKGQTWGRKVAMEKASRWTG